MIWLKFPFKKRPPNEKKTYLKSFRKKFQSYSGEKLNWFQVILRLQESVIPAILPWVLLCGGYGFLISLLYIKPFSLNHEWKSCQPPLVLAVLKNNISLVWLNINAILSILVYRLLSVIKELNFAYVLYASLNAHTIHTLWSIEMCALTL